VCVALFILHTKRIILPSVACLAVTYFSTLSHTRLHRTIILPLVLYGCETWCFTLREGCRLRVFENRDEVTGDYRRLHNKELYALYSPDIIRVIKSIRLRWAEHVARIGGEEMCIQGFSGET
jgi:hypothetical protein